MKTYIQVVKNPNVKLRPGQIIGFNMSPTSKTCKGFVQTKEYPYYEINENTKVRLLAADSIHLYNGWSLCDGDSLAWKDAIDWLIKNGKEIHVFDSCEELLRWLCSTE